MAERGTRFALATEITEAALTARLVGDIDVSSMGVVGELLFDAVIALPPPNLVVLDLRAVTFFAAAAVHAVEHFGTACATRGVRVHLVALPDGIVSHVLAVSGLAARLPVFTAPDQAP